MSEISKLYDPQKDENKWYTFWMDQGLFRSVPDEREPYTVVIPPPNVTGVLHMGHMLNNTIQDVLVRRARMLGKNACWVPGTDHASIATEARVVAMLREKGIRKSEIGREAFLKHAWEWKEKYGGIILEQLKKLGASCDWERTRFTMDPAYYKEVIDVFIDLYDKGHIYRGLRMVNWDPVARTAVSDEEVEFKEVQSRLVYVRYRTEAGDGHLTVATVRPETIMGDVAVAVHPDDERYKHLHGTRVIVPMVDRPVPVITDDHIDPEFGTGCLKVTPAHDSVDYEIGLRHNLPVIDTLNEDGTLSAEAKVFVGMDRFAARKAVMKRLEEEGLIEKTEDYRHQVGHSERTHAVIEPRLSMQWFLRMKALSKPALEAVLGGDVKLIPQKFINTYRHWMENVRDWCLSRQLWWGHRIPAWYDPEGRIAVAADAEGAMASFRQQFPDFPYRPGELKQDEDVLDTWASSWLWPISVFNGLTEPDNEDIRYYYPTNDLVTAPEILFFWVARMIMAGYEYRNERPFRNVYLTGIVRDKQGRKMSKSLGNSPEPLELIARYGADGVRVGMLLSSPAGNDLLFDEAHCEQGRNFANKIWNAFRLVQGWQVDRDAPERDPAANAWFRSRLREAIGQIDSLYGQYRISEVLMATYKLVWDDFCSWYLEMVKPEFTDGVAGAVDGTTYDTVIGGFEQVLQLLHPFMPFITEELWHLIRERKDEDCIMISAWPAAGDFDEGLLRGFSTAAQVVVQVRNLRKEKNISPKEALSVHVQKGTGWPEVFGPVIRKLANVDDIRHDTPAGSGTVTLMVDRLEIVVPVGANVDPAAERKKLEGEIAYNKGFLATVMKKLDNPGFVSNAKPAVIDLERKKKADTEEKIRLLEKQLESLG